jgi:hypothetical protein
MSKDWDNHEYVDAVRLWEFVDTLQNSIELHAADEIGKTSECFKMYLLGKRATVEKIADYLSVNELVLKDIITEGAGAVPNVSLKTLDNDKVAEVYAEEWYATHGPIGRPIFSLDCREAFLAGFSIAMQLVKSQVAIGVMRPPQDSSTHFEPCVAISKLPKQVRP